MKQAILFLIFVCFHWTLAAQLNAGVEPDPVYGAGTVDEGDIVAHGILKNNESDTLVLRWKRIEVDMPVGWSTWVCDPNLCYGPWISVTPNEFPMAMAGGEGGTMDVHIKPNDIAGTGTIKLEITLFNDTSVVVDTAIYIFEAGSTSTTDLTKDPEVKVFPNPTTNYISLSNDQDVEQIVIYNVLGRRVRSFTTAQGPNYSVADLPSGIYMLSLMNRQSKIIKTLRLSKK